MSLSSIAEPRPTRADECRVQAPHFLPVHGVVGVALAAISGGRPASHDVQGVDPTVIDQLLIGLVLSRPDGGEPFGASDDLSAKADQAGGIASDGGAGSIGRDGLAGLDGLHHRPVVSAVALTPVQVVAEQGRVRRGQLGAGTGDVLALRAGQTDQAAFTLSRGPADPSDHIQRHRPGSSTARHALSQEGAGLFDLVVRQAGDEGGRRLADDRGGPLVPGVEAEADRRSGRHLRLSCVGP